MYAWNPLGKQDSPESIYFGHVEDLPLYDQEPGLGNSSTQMLWRSKPPALGLSQKWGLAVRMVGLPMWVWWSVRGQKQLLLRRVAFNKDCRSLLLLWQQRTVAMSKWESTLFRYMGFHSIHGNLGNWESSFQMTTIPGYTFKNDLEQTYNNHHPYYHHYHEFHPHQYFYNTTICSGFF